MPKHAGISFPFTDSSILTINSPRKYVKGPWCVVAKGAGPKARWAIVALEWAGGPSLGIRWFDRTAGTPISSSYATWFIIPDIFQLPLISWLKKYGRSEYASIVIAVEKYLNGDLTVDELRKEINNTKPHSL